MYSKIYPNFARYFDQKKTKVRTWHEYTPKIQCFGSGFFYVFIQFIRKVHHFHVILIHCWKEYRKVTYEKLLAASTTLITKIYRYVIIFQYGHMKTAFWESLAYFSISFQLISFISFLLEHNLCVCECVCVQCVCLW